jgi:multidrug efflux pump subunit AcrB
VTGFNLSAWAVRERTLTLFFILVALILGVVMRKNFNGLTLGKTLGAEQAAIQRQLPVGFELSRVSYQGTIIDEAIDEFMLKFFVALAVVMIVTLFTLGFRVGVVVALAVPLTLSAVFVIMLLTGRDFDRISLGALILALGLLVDDAIISIEMMVVKIQEGMDRVRAATYAWTSTAGPMLSGTLITIAGFLPIGFAASSAGDYAGNIFWVVGFALMMSWLVAVMFTPYLGVTLLPNIKTVEGGHDAIYSTPNYERFRRLIRTVVDYKWFVGICGCGHVLRCRVRHAVRRAAILSAHRSAGTAGRYQPPGLEQHPCPYYPPGSSSLCYAATALDSSKAGAPTLSPGPTHA